VHFRRAWLSDEEIGYRAGAAAISDLAAMAATPVALLASIAAPTGGAIDVQAVHAGVRRSAQSVGASVIGGDLSRSPGPLILDVVVLGCTAWPVLRDGAEPGDEIWVTGVLGASAAAVHAWEAGEEPAAELRAAYADPTPRVDEARWLVEHEVVDALIDLSDGLVGDLGHLAAASGVCITIDTQLVPVAPLATESLGEEAALQAALGGGEDFELAFAADPGAVDAGYFETRYGLVLTRIGRVSEGAGVWLDDGAGSARPAEARGFDHWREVGA
jgi:thiamine-monophosphate kinase